jgi:RNA polymerase sigma factor (sigma-70 family)
MESRKSDSAISGPAHEPAPDAISNWPNADMFARISKLAAAAARAAHLPEEREDGLQSALLRYWQLTQESPGKTASWYLLRCRGIILDRLKRGTSVDSPRRRWLGCSIDAEDVEAMPGTPELVSETNPAQLVSILDALNEMRARLDGRENAILQLLFEGNTTREVAKRVHISPAAVSKRRRRIRSVAREIGFCREDLRSGRKIKN